MIDPKKYSALAAKLLEPFDDSQIRQREGSGGKNFSYVPPEEYRYRLLESFPHGFAFGVIPGSTRLEKTGVHAEFAFEAEDPDTLTRYKITATAFEPWTLARETGAILNPDQTFAKLMSAGLKACCREIGIGLHLYDKGDSQSTGSSKSTSKTQTKASSKSEHGEWDGELTLKSGKHKGKKWKDTPDSFVEFLANMDEPNELAIKELARRASADSEDEETQESDDDLPF